MKNAILPSVSSQLHSFGSMSQSIYEVPAQIDGTLNFYGNSFNCMDSNLYNNQYDFAIPPQFPIDYQSGLSTIMTMKRLDCPYDGALGYPTCTSTTTYDDMDDPLQPLPFTKKLSVPLRLDDTDEAIKNPRKRPIEATKEDSKIRVSSNKIVVNQWNKTNKKMAHQEQQPSQDKKKQEAFDHIPRQKAPVRRSQKLSDKITALQKLVSPYGKTDTASVLEEASISINLLQHQIQNLFNNLSSSSINTEPLQYQKPHDLRNRGLCLVPVSFTQRLTEPERFTQRPMSRNHAMPRNF